MRTVVDTSVLVDHLRGHVGAHAALRSSRMAGTLLASEITRIEVLSGMRPTEEPATRSLLATIDWQAVDASVAERAGALGRRWLASHHTIDAADLAIAATAELAGAPLLTRNVKHFPMFPGLRPPY